MPLTLRALSFASLLGETLALYRRHFFLFLGISAIPNLLLLMIQFGLERIPLGRPGHPELLGGFAALGLSLASLFASSIVTAGTTAAVSDIYTDRLPDLWDSFARLSGKSLRILGASFLTELFILLGTFLCIVPGIYFAGRYGLAIPAVVLEGLGPKKALDRSGELTKDSTARIILVFFLTWILTGVLVLLLNSVIESKGWAPFGPGALSNHTWNLLTTTLGGIFFGPISAIALALEYFDLRVRFEGFDVQKLQKLMSVPEIPPVKSYADINS